MRSLLARLPCRQALGLYVGDGEIALSRVAATLAGPVEIARTCLPCPADSQAEMLQTLLGSGRKRPKNRPLLALGIPAQQVFFSTRPIRTTDDSATPQVLLHEVLRSPNIAIDDMVVDVIRAHPESRKVASIVACRKKFLHRLLGDLRKQAVRIVLAEPAPCALLRLAASQHPAPRRVRTLIRVFLGNHKGIAIGVAGQIPLLWRSFSLPELDESSVIRAQIRALETLVVYCGVETVPGAIMVHGRPDLRERLQRDPFIQKMGSRLHWTDGPTLDAPTIAHGLALGAVNIEHDGFDMARSLKPPLSFREMFPWKELVVQTAIVLGMGLFLYVKAQDLGDKHLGAQLEIQQRPWQQGIDESALLKEKKELKERVEAVQKFISSRVLWSAYSKDIAERLPPTASLERLQGLAEFSTDAVKPGQRALMIKASVPIGSQGGVPAEVNSFLNDLRSDPLLLHDFPTLTMEGVEWVQPPDPKAKPIATFKIIALPKPKEKKPPSE